MHTRSGTSHVPVLLQRLPDLLDRLPPIPDLPEPLRRFGARLSRLNAWQVFAAMVPAGLTLGLLLSLAVDPEMLQRAGKPYIERLDDGVRVELAQADNSYPVDPAPFGYPDIAAAEPEPAIDAAAADIAADVPPPALITDGEVLAQPAVTAPAATIPVVSVITPQP
jgi:hypothetical protein